MEIKRAISSVLNQSYPHFEIIIIDDGSTDNSLQQAQSIVDPRIRIISQDNAGVSTARNRGVAEAQYDWVAFLDADDEWESDFLFNIDLLMNRLPNCGVYASSYRIINFEGRKESPISQYAPGSTIIISDIFSDFRSYYPFNSSSVIVDKSKLIQLGGFPLNVHEGEDVITWIKLFLISQIAIINLPLSVYHQEATNRACYELKDRLEVYPPVNFLINANKQGGIPEKFNTSVIEYIAKHQIVAAKRNIRQRNSYRAIELLWSCRKTNEQKITWLRTFFIAIISIFIPHFSKQA